MKFLASLAVFGSVAFGLGTARGELARVTVTNLSPSSGIFLTPVWLGFHNGSFDLYDPGVAVGAGGLPAGLEALAEDGNNAPLSANFAASSAGAAGGFDATLPGLAGIPGDLDPGESASAVFDLDAVANRFFSYASMVIPSNDAFIANGNPLVYPLFDADGRLVGTDFLVLGSAVLDAGTEVNTEMDAAFLNQTAPNTGVTQDGTVGPHPGFNGSVGNPGGLPMNILGTTMAGPNQDIPIGVLAGDFSAQGYQVARITITAVPEPASVATLGIGLVGILGVSLRRGRRAAA